MDLQPRIAICRKRWQQAPLSRAFAPLADLLRQAKRLDEALAVLDEGLSRHPDFTGGLVVLARTLDDAERHEKACRVLERVLELDPENLVAHRLLAADAERRQDWHAARRHLRELLRLDPDDRRWATEMARVTGRLSRAEPGAAAAAAGGAGPREGGGPSFATLTMVDICLAQGYRGRAIDALQQMLAADPDRPDLQRRLAELKAAAADDDAGEDGQRGESPVQPRRRRDADRAQFAAWIDRLRDAPEQTR